MPWGVRDLEVRYGGLTAVSGVSLNLPRGTVVALVGGDGAGKTSVLRALVGVVRPAAGEVEAPEPERIGYVSAGPGVYADLSVGENLAFAARAYGLDPPTERARAEELLERTGLAGARDRLGAQLSGGMRRKLALAGALLHRPELLVLDEPTTGVDPVSRAELWRMIAAAAARGAAVALATTYLDEAERAGSLVFLHRGRQLAAGRPQQVTGAMPGAVLEAGTRPAGVAAWRHGRRWRVWSPDGRELPGAARVRPRLEDAVIVATLGEAAGAGKEA
jgi:ABC-2 type transport system ATP-binding protein